MDPETASEGKPSPVGVFQRTRVFLRLVIDELQRATWPSRREVRATTVVVVVTSIVMGLYLWSLDLLFDRMQIWLIRHFVAQ